VSINYVDRSQRANHYITPPPQPGTHSEGGMDVWRNNNTETHLENAYTVVNNSEEN